MSKAEELTTSRGKKLGLSYGEVIEQLKSTPGMTSGAFGLALCLCMLEVHRYPVIQLVQHNSSFTACMLAVITLLALVLGCKLGFAKVLRRQSVVVVCSIAATLCLYLYFTTFNTDVASLSLSWIGAHAFIIFSMILLSAWVDELYKRGPVVGALVFMMALPLAFCIQALAGLLTSSVARGACALFPIMVAVLLLVFRNTGRNTLPFGYSTPEEEPVSKPAHASRLPWVALGLVALCCGIFFTRMHMGWLPMQDAGDDAVIQLYSAAGALIAGVIVFAIRPFPGKDNGIVVCQSVILVFAFFCMYLSTLNNMVFGAVYLIPLNTAQKILLYMMFCSCLSLESREQSVMKFCLLFACYRAGYGLFFLAGVASGGSYAMELTDLLFVIALAVSVALLIASMAAPAVMLPPTVMVNELQEVEQGDDSPYKEIAFYFLFGQKYSLTQREVEILPLLASMKNARAIADSLCVTQATVKTHIRNIYAKLNVHAQADLAELVERERGLLLSQLPEWYER